MSCSMKANRGNLSFDRNLLIKAFFELISFFKVQVSLRLNLLSKKGKIKSIDLELMFCSRYADKRRLHLM